MIAAWFKVLWLPGFVQRNLLLRRGHPGATVCLLESGFARVDGPEKGAHLQNLMRASRSQCAVDKL